ncbi:MAG TPA: serine hydrolase domain-containing protein [Pyrinomonadaceae bacterium]|nr:serine hydrolase domain-containing protein [Pyrinomonadaceae bacterium]
MQASLTTRDNHISAMLAERISAADFPSAVYLIAEKGRTVFADALGHAVVDPYLITASLNTIYDLASLTKPLVTGMLCSQLVEKGELTLDSAVAHYLPEFERTDRQMITVRELLTHTSGLPAWRPLYILAEGERERALGVIANEALECKPGTRVIYSDLGFIVLGFLLERLMGKGLDELARTEIIEPLKLQHTFFNPEMALQTGIAACETGNMYERETALALGAEHYAEWREQVIWGEVHDGNSYFLGGVAGHAGLFSTANETLRLATQFLPQQSELLSAEACTELFTRNMTKGLEEARSISWQLAQSPQSAAGPSLPTDSFGHSGFTGTSCWIDPHHERVFILLTNRTHARSLPFVNINSVRREFHSLATAALTLGQT